MRKKIQQQTASADIGKSTTPADKPKPGPSDAIIVDGEINWQRFLRLSFDDEIMGFADARDHRLLSEHMNAMTAEELIAALEETRLLELSLEQRYDIDNIFIQVLTVKDPGKLLNAFKDQLTGSHQHELNQAFRSLAEKDVMEAARWLDVATAAGHLAPRGLEKEDFLRRDYETNLIGAMLTRNLEAAATRLSGMNENDRLQVLKQTDTGRLDAEQTKALGQMFRNLLSGDMLTEISARHAAARMGSGNLSEVTEFLELIGSTPQIGRQTASMVLEKSFNPSYTYRLPQVEKLRTWAVEHLGEDVEEALGTVIGSTLFQHGSSSDTDLILHYHAAHPSDEFLLAAISNARRIPKPQQQQILNTITDETLRQDIITLLEKK